MKYFLIIVVFVAMSCKTSKPVNLAIVSSEAVFVQSENCPENGTCLLELIPNKTIDFKKDEFGNLYPVISDGINTIFKYTFTKNPIQDIEDSNYTEIVYAEISVNNTINLQDEALKNIKMHYGRLCFCKGESGYFPVTRGVFNLSKTGDNSVKIDVDFMVKKVSQIISEIHETVSLKSTTSN